MVIGVLVVRLFNGVVIVIIVFVVEMFVFVVASFQPPVVVGVVQREVLAVRCDNRGTTWL